MNPPWPPLQVVSEADERSLLDALRSGDWSSHAATERFERAFSSFCGVRHCLLVTNGTTALKLALAALGVRPGDEVIIPGLTWPSVAIAVMECGAEPVPVDIDLQTFGMRADAVAAAVTQRTVAIVPTHLFSSQTHLPPILDVASRHGLAVVEDCAHSPGARRFGKALGTFGNAGIFSFNQKKLLSCGEGGCLITNDFELYGRARAMREVSPDESPAGGLSGTHLVSTFQAAVLTAQLLQLPERLKAMQVQAELLRSLLSRFDRVQPLICLPETDLQTYYNFCFRMIDVRDIAGFRKTLAAELSLPMSGAYVPLSDTPAVDTGRDPRFSHLGSKLRTRLPNCATAHYEQAVRFRHHALRADEESMHRIAAAVEKALR